MAENNNVATRLNHTKVTKKAAPKLSIEEFEGSLVVDEMQELINSCKIDLLEKLAPPPVAMEVMSDGKPITLFSKGNFSIVTGPAKSRKSFLISMLVAAAIKGNLQGMFHCSYSGTNILIDTEQSRYKSQQIAKRICELSENVSPSNFDIYSLRTLEPSQRLDLIDRVLETTSNVNFVAIDGIIDLEIDPILQADQAQKIILKLMKWSEIYNIHIVCVLHYNKTVATLLGHLGSFGHRKADAVIEVLKSKADAGISEVKAIDCREKEFEPFAFSVDQMGLPYILEDYTFEKAAKGKQAACEPRAKAITANQLDTETHTEILTRVFNIQKEQGYSELFKNIKDTMEKEGKPIGDNRAKDFVTYYLNNESIIKVEAPKKKTVYVMAGQRILDF